MASRRAQRQYAFVLSVLGHAAIVLMLTFSVPLWNRDEAPGPFAGEIVPVSAFMVDSAVLEEEVARLEAEEAAAEAERIRQEQAAEQARQEELERQERVRQEQEERARLEAEQAEAAAAAERERIRLDAERQAAEEARLEAERLEAERLEAERLAAEEERLRQEEEERRRQEEERQRQEELARQRAEEEARRQREAEEAARLARIEADIERARQAERAAQEARDSGLRAQWAQAIGDRVELYWNKPPNAGAGLECVLLVTQLPNGEVIDVAVEDCNRDDPNIIRSIESAVLNASPLPGPPRGVPFERVVRITFLPE